MFVRHGVHVLFAHSSINVMWMLLGLRVTSVKLRDLTDHKRWRYTSGSILSLRTLQTLCA